MAKQSASSLEPTDLDAPAAPPAPRTHSVGATFVARMAFFHRDGAGAWHPFDASQNALLEQAFQADAPSVVLPTVPGNPPGHRDFEVRFGANAVSARMPAAPPTKMIQVNTQNGNTRVVRRDMPQTSSLDRSMELAENFETSAACYGWLLKKKLGGLARGSWQRRFFVLAPRSGALLCFAKGLDTRQVQLCREGDKAAPKAEVAADLAGAMVVRDGDPAKPCSFAVTTPAGEHHLAAHDDALKDRWLDQLARVARGEALA